MPFLPHTQVLALIAVAVGHEQSQVGGGIGVVGGPAGADADVDAVLPAFADEVVGGVVLLVVLHGQQVDLDQAARSLFHALLVGLGAVGAGLSEHGIGSLDDDGVLLGDLHA